jgi:phage FluMu gp28-like protein
VLFSKSYANSDGDSNKIEPLYMQYRVQAIKDILSSISIAYDEISREKLFDFIANGFRNEEQLLLSHKEILEKEYHITAKEKEFMEKYNCNIESEKIKISNEEIIISTYSGIKRYIR